MMNVKNQVPLYTRDLEYLRTVKDRFATVQAKMVKASKKSKIAGKEFHQEVENSEKVKCDEEKNSQRVVEDLTTTEKYLMKLNNKLEE